MKLYEKLPDRVKVGKRNIRVNLDFRNVLRMIEILSRDDLFSDAREYLAMKCICKHPVKGMYAPVRKMLFPDVEEHEKITDFEQDADLIVSAFRQAYGIDLFREKLHWLEFCCLLGCIPEGNRYADVIGIRTRPIPRETKYNAEERAWLMKAKAEFALDKTAEEQEKAYSKGVQMVSAFLLSLAEKGEPNG